MTKSLADTASASSVDRRSAILRCMVFTLRGVAMERGAHRFSFTGLVFQYLFFKFINLIRSERVPGIYNDGMYLLLARSLPRLILQLGYFFEEVVVIPPSAITCIFLLLGSASQLILSSLYCVTLHGEQSSVESDLVVPGAVRSHPPGP